jgi:hypothetical protein
LTAKGLNIKVFFIQSVLFQNDLKSPRPIIIRKMDSQQIFKNGSRWKEAFCFTDILCYDQ